MWNLQFAGQRTATGFHLIDNRVADLEVVPGIIRQFVVFCSKKKFARVGTLLLRRRRGIAATRASRRANQPKDAENSRFTGEMRAPTQEYGPPYSILMSKVKSKAPKEPYSMATTELT